MTPVDPQHPTRRETASTVRAHSKYRPLVIEIRPYSVFLRAKGMRSGYEVDLESIWSLGAKKAAEARRAAKKAGKKQK